jgi:hypothetical protein
MCTFQSVTPLQDLVATDIVFPHYAEESFEVRYSPEQQWYYQSLSTREDIILLKVFDSKATDSTAFCMALLNS